MLFKWSFDRKIVCHPTWFLAAVKFIFIAAVLFVLYFLLNFSYYFETEIKKSYVWENIFILHDYVLTINFTK